ncbi:hypothetical protein AJ80_03430 [Polytolypa hystricis UAMH7299]|uniref:Kynurenine formamidase n=1 Tax=Polytolypa hystricis (strain UAMH7299) TaxID=1447883 RepID=A0A2B7YIG5_POLH7|nr:hypothetical protein AJ80_03430 [Polytolypa hystricis UAMH7299]
MEPAERGVPSSGIIEYPKCLHHRYAHDSVLQDISVYLPRALPQEGPLSGYWIIYIHGGAWRDPLISASSFARTGDILISKFCSDESSDILGFASINYRLSAHPNFQQDLESTDPTAVRNAVHPNHLNDVRQAIAFLQSTYSFDEQYILAGHSCGATLAFQAVMGTVAGVGDGDYDASVSVSEIVQPLAIVGVEGIYDLRRLRDSFSQYGIYQEFIEGAFGKDEDVWDGASPSKVEGAAGVEEGWKNGRLAILAQSKGDELVDASQLKDMSRALEKWKSRDGQGQRDVLLIEDLEGGHDEVWEKGEELAAVISKAVERLKGLAQS